MRAGAYAGAPQSDKKRGVSSKTAVLTPLRRETSGTIFLVAFFSKIQNAPESRKGGSAKSRKRGTRRSGTLCEAKENRFLLYGEARRKKRPKSKAQRGLEDGAKARRKKTEEEGQSRRNQKTPARCFGKAFALCFFCTRFRRFSDCQRERRTAKAAGISGRNGRVFFVPFTALPAPPKLPEGRAKKSRKSRNRENYRARRSKIFPSRSFQRSSPPSNTA